MVEQRRQRASVPAFGGWDDMAAGGALPDYSLDFSRIRAARMQRRIKALSWSGAEERQLMSSTAAGGGGSEDRGRRRRHRRHRRQHSDDAAEARQPIRAPPKQTGRSKLKGYLFGCMSPW